MRPYWWLYKGFEVRENNCGREKVYIKSFPQDLEENARSNPTPMYLINAGRSVENIQTTRNAFSSQYPGIAEIHFAMKECHIPQVLELIFAQARKLVEVRSDGRSSCEDCRLPSPQRVVGGHSSFSYGLWVA